MATLLTGNSKIFHNFNSCSSSCVTNIKNHVSICSLSSSFRPNSYPYCIKSTRLSTVHERRRASERLFRVPMISCVVGDSSEIQSDTQKIEKALDEAVDLLNRTQLKESIEQAEVDELEDKLKEWKNLCNSILAKMSQGGAGGDVPMGGSADAGAGYGKGGSAANGSETQSDMQKIEKILDEAVDLSDRNQLAEVDELEDKLKEWKNLCNSIIAEIDQGGAGGDVPMGGSADAGAGAGYGKGGSAANGSETQLDMQKIEKILDEADKQKIEKILDEAADLLDRNELAELDEVEDKLKELENLRNLLTAKMDHYQGVVGGDVS